MNLTQSFIHCWRFCTCGAHFERSAAWGLGYLKLKDGVETSSPAPGPRREHERYASYSLKGIYIKCYKWLPDTCWIVSYVLQRVFISLLTIVGNLTPKSTFWPPLVKSKIVSVLILTSSIHSQFLNCVAFCSFFHFSVSGWGVLWM